MARDVDVVVVGAGPAGSAAAITLARAGRSVLVVDKARFPRDKCCGDGLTALALRQLEALGLEPSAVPSWTVVERAVLHSPSGRVATLPLPEGCGQFAAVTRRTELDAALVEVARAAGASVEEGAALLDATARTDRVILQVERLGELRAAHVIGADGMWSPLRKALGCAVPGYRGEWHAFRQYVTDVDTAVSDALHVIFDDDLLPGYIWSFPLPDGRANVGFGILRGGPVEVGEMGPIWAGLLDRPRVRALLGPRVRPESPHRAWPIPARLGAVPLSAGRTLFVGDAAATTDPLTGEGIGQALLTGVLAAEAIIGSPLGQPIPGGSRVGGSRVGGSALDGSTSDRGAAEPPSARYEAAVRSHLAADHRLAEALSRLLARRWGARGAVRAAGLTAWTRRNFARWMFEDYPRAVLATPTRWRPGTFTGPGAYAGDAATPAPTPSRHR